MSETGAPPPDPVRADRKAVLGWCLYDWANSAFPTLIATFVFAAYFTQGIAPSKEEGTALWGTMTGLSALAIALMAPVLGAIADFGRRRKPWLGFFTALTALATALLWFAEPSEAWILYALVFAGLGTIGFELGMVFYNAMLPAIAPKAMLGRVSGWGWGLGYIGGLAALGVSFVGFVGADDPWFGVSTENAENIRAVPVVAAVWIAVFCLPIFLLTPDAPPKDALPLRQAARAGLKAVWGTLKRVREYRTIARFLLARMLYTDGLNTLFAFGGIYAAGTFGMAQQEVLIFGASLNVTAGIGALIFAFLDDRWGPKPVIMISVGTITVLGAAMLFVEDKAVFWALGLGLGAFLGPAQAASRSLMADLAPPDLRAEFFGLYALSGKATAFLGPLLVGWVTALAASQRVGMATILIFLVAGLVLMRPLKAGMKGRGRAPALGRGGG
ncbi:MAG: MFS transporter [Marivibrio sp.]|uniref:MFS transporter n=1 Tax=Marivibrio sp. TaxID=2039719 RepID=UPI0032EB0BD6